MSVHFKTALSNIRRSPFQAVAAVMVFTITFFVLTWMAVLVHASGKLIAYFEARPQVIAFLKKETTNEAISRLQNKLINDTRVKDVEYVSKEEALSIYKEATSDNPLLAELVSPSIFPASLEFSLNDLSQAEEIIEEIKKETIVDQVGFTASLGGEAGLADTVANLKKVSRYVRLGGGILTGVLVVTSLVVLLVILSLRLMIRRSEVEVLSLIGAGSGFLRAPVVIEAFAYALAGVFIGWLIALVTLLYLTPSAVAYFSEIPVLPKSAGELVYLLGVILAGEVAASLLLAGTASWLAIKRSRKPKR